MHEQKGKEVLSSTFCKKIIRANLKILMWLVTYVTDYEELEANKGVWWMPRLSKTTKDAISCEKLRGGANNL